MQGMLNRILNPNTEVEPVNYLECAMADVQQFLSRIHFGGAGNSVGVFVEKAERP